MRWALVVGKLRSEGGKGVLARDPSWPAAKHERLLSTGVMVKFLRRALPDRSQCYEFLEFWDHGMGAFGYGSSESGKHMQVLDIVNSIQKAFAWPNRRKFDLLGFDACYMSSFEVAYGLHPYANYMIASEESEPNGGWDYRDMDIASRLAKVTDPVTLGKDVVIDFLNHNSEAPLTLELVNLTVFGRLAGVFDTICKRLVQQLKAGELDAYVAIARARQGSTKFASSVNATGGRSHVDFGNFLFELGKHDSTARQAYAIYTGDLFVSKGMGKWAMKAGYTGMSIFFPSFGETSADRKRSSQKVSAYRRTGTRAMWSHVLDAYLKFRPKHQTAAPVRRGLETTVGMKVTTAPFMEFKA